MHVQHDVSGALFQMLPACSLHLCICCRAQRIYSQPLYLNVRIKVSFFSLSCAKSNFCISTIRLSLSV